MNKHQLANNIWAAANTMCSKIATNEYKDYIRGLIVYKYLSDIEETFLYKNVWNGDSIENVEDPDSAALTNCSRNDNLSYLIN